MSGRVVPLLGLTATASEPVRRDLQHTLELNDDAVFQLESSDRPNLSLSVHADNQKSAQGKSEIVAELIKKKIPAILQIEPELLLGEVGGPSSARWPRLRITPAQQEDHDGRRCPEITSRLSKTLGIGIRPFKQAAWPLPEMSQPQDHQGSCTGDSQRSLQAVRVSRRNGCPAFDKPELPPDWDQTLERNHQDFQPIAFPSWLRQGFGMGSTSRTSVTSFTTPSRAVSRATFRRPGAQDVTATTRILRSSIRSLTRSASTTAHPPKQIALYSRFSAFTYHSCPYNLPRLCDFGRRRASSRTPTPVSRRMSMKRSGCGDDLCLSLRRSTIPVRSVNGDLEDSEEDDSSAEELAAVRLQHLGLIKGFVVDYEKRRPI